MKTDENTTMPLARIARAYYQLATKTSRYLFSDSRQRIVAYIIIFLCFLTPPSTSFVLYQGTSAKIEYKDVNMLKEMKIEDRKVIFEFCNFVVKFPQYLVKKMTLEQVRKSKPICEQLLLGIAKVREQEARAHRAHRV
ncbi:uncharacterized protein CELE_C07C7.1 [Caenorhabditis elegans]|uniref:Transmembrane protein n=1 Tax=Caenorhabditis elegans TaxID=6239 RepID=Q17779_CAEEL|nr:Transmembrane protein [Caenorhabditis elegans]CAA92587.3 Transmembrane protein [Caenorhabditis elegans]|eukprot:NP_501600.3 Uncharacterized protein CELE_C07C7.1 [Caenorhabditis elegans]